MKQIENLQITVRRLQIGNRGAKNLLLELCNYADEKTGVAEIPIRTLETILETDRMTIRRATAILKTQNLADHKTVKVKGFIERSIFTLDIDEIRRRVMAQNESCKKSVHMARNESCELSVTWLKLSHVKSKSVHMAQNESCRKSVHMAQFEPFLMIVLLNSILKIEEEEKEKEANDGGGEKLLHAPAHVSENAAPPPSVKVFDSSLPEHKKAFALMANLCFQFPIEKSHLLKGRNAGKIEKAIGELLELEADLSLLEFFGEFWKNDWRSMDRKYKKFQAVRPEQFAAVWFEFLTSDDLTTQRKEIEENAEKDIDERAGRREPGNKFDAIEKYDYSDFADLEFGDGKS